MESFENLFSEGPLNMKIAIIDFEIFDQKRYKRIPKNKIF